MTALAIARSELTLTLRNKAVAATAVFIPLAMGGWLAWNVESDAEVAGALAVSIALVMFALSGYTTATITLSARRKELFLKRLRSSTASDGAILAGMLLPPVLITVVQVAVIYAFLAYSAGGAPQSIPILVVAVVATTVMCAGAALLTSTFTKSAEQAQVTTLPFLLAFIAGGVWVVYAGMDDLEWLKRIAPGGAPAELISQGWTGMVWTDALPALAVLAVWTVAAVAAGLATFRWEPRA